jgi:hypothetical protein
MALAGLQGTGHLGFTVPELDEADEFRSSSGAADGQRGQPRNSDVAGHYLAFYVHELDAAVDYLRSKRVRVLGQPVASRNVSAGQRWICFLALWGMQFELVSFPHGKAYEKDAPVLLWNPVHPAE